MKGFKIIRAFGLAFLLIAAYVQCAKVHDEMTDDEIENLFHTTRENVPEYDVVPVRHNMHKRSDPKLRLQFNAFGKKIDVYLQPSDSFLAGRYTPVWLAYSKPGGGIEYKKLRRDIVGIVAGFFNSPIDLSTVVISEGEDPSIEGMVNGMAIRPLPQRLQQTMKRKREAPTARQNLTETHYHVIIKSPLLKEEAKLIKLERQIREASKSARNVTDSSKTKRSTQDTIYPSILIRTDFKGSKTTKNDLAYYDEIMYQLAFWNGVDLRYREVKDPKVRLRIAGIIIGQDRGATPYMNNHREGEEVDVNAGWTDMQDFWLQMRNRPEFPLEAYDIIVTMTNLPMKGKATDGSDTAILGLASARSLCREFYRLYALAVVQDKGGFDGILTAAHELGHVMGLDHDEATGDDCDKSYGFIMQPSDVVSRRNLEWSRCSLQTLSYFLRQSSKTCADDPAEFHTPGPPVQRFLPGDVVDTHKQCQGRGYQWACDARPDMCLDMYCYYTHWDAFKYGWWCKSTGPAAEGTACSPGHKCVNGVCTCVTEECIFEKTEKPV